ncbi:tyrosine phosphatase family protein [Pararhizobium antarcticum]|uniref:Protein tyrosine phosphatase n=1 Tax=Pararhizobium antarcticum TaxID=1798805 RepID=A0A657LN81_9HYPH|nr:tyrosine phosphatase family protein [Pararhizobium antarcticum]OJF92885.1 protein tyrosine phosphatase [Pararhizobium antarcticum]OJF97728.1 protein tyrosine phosphatase [Rhizobium sp. 58]
MSHIVVAPLSRIAEMAVRHGCRDMVSLLAKGQAFHRPAVIAADRHLVLGVNDITFNASGKTAGGLIAPQEEHVAAVIAFSRDWDRAGPLLVHCWMGVSRSPAAAAIVALAVEPDQDDLALALRLRASSPFATPNSRLIEIGDHLLGRQGRLIAAIKAIGRGADADGNTPFVLAIRPEGAINAG